MSKVTHSSQIKNRSLYRISYKGQSCVASASTILSASHILFLGTSELSSVRLGTSELDYLLSTGAVKIMNLANYKLGLKYEDSVLGQINEE